MKTPWTILILMFSIALCRAELDENAARNGDFEDGINGWRFVLTHRPDGPTEYPAKYLAWEQKDTAGKSKGSLRVTLPPSETPVLQTHNTGALCELSRSIKHLQNDIRVRFSARLVDGAEILHLTRTWGGDSAATVSITPEWKSYEITLKIQHDTDKLNFALIPAVVNQKGQETVGEGTFLLDNVEVIPIEKLAE